MGLPTPAPARPLQALAEAHAAFVAVGLEEVVPRGRRTAGEGSPVLLVLGSALGCVLVAALLTRPLADAATAEPGWQLTGQGEVASLRVDGVPQGGLTAEQLSVAEVESRLSERLPEGTDVVVAARPASAYLVRDSGPQDSSRSIYLDSAGTRDRLARLKLEFPDLVDPATQDLRPGAVIVPVFVEFAGHSLDRVATGQDPDHASILAAGKVEDVARGIQSEGAFAPDVDAEGMWALLTASGAVVLGAVLAAVSTLLGALGRRSRHGTPAGAGR